MPHSGDPADPVSELRARVEALERELARRDARLVEVYGASADEVIERTGRLALLGSLAAGIAHEINGPLGSIVVSSELALMQLDALPDPQRAELRETLQRHLDDARRAGRITRDLLELVRAEPAQRRATELDPVVAGAVERARRLAPGEVELELDPAGEPLLVGLSPGQIELLVLNLLVNASDPEVGARRVRVQTRRDGGAACLRVTDDGRGVPEELRQRIFETLYTTRPGRGTGLGLSLARSIAGAHGGQVLLEPAGAEPGSSFLVRLPLASGAFPGQIA